MLKLEQEVWISDIKENPIPDSSFINASVDYSEFVNNDKVHLQEAGASPNVRTNFFSGTTADTPLPVQIINDIPHEKEMETFSTEQTRHHSLIDIELSYPKRQSIINRHKDAIAKKMADLTAWQWAPEAHNTHNNVMQVASSGSIIDAIMDLEAWYRTRTITSQINLCINPTHLAMIKKEDKVLYKSLFQEPGAVYNSFKLWSYPDNPIYWSGRRQPSGSIAYSGYQISSFAWVSNEVFRAFGDVKMFQTIGEPGWQADLISFSRRAVAAPIRANAPKNFGAILTTI